jgi:hypothetical protein
MGNGKIFRPASYTLVFLMMVCLIMTVSNLIHLILPGWHAGIIAGILFFIVIDRLYTYRQLKFVTPWTSEWVISFGVQWIVILIVSRFLLSYAGGVTALLADLSLFGRGYLTDLFTPEFMISVLLMVAVWQLTTQFLNLLDEIGLDIQWALHEVQPYLQSDTVPAHQRMVSLILTIGIGLVILTVLTRINVGTILSTGGMPHIQLTRFSGAEAGALLYFVFGLALLSLSRLMSLQTHWNRLRIPVSSSNLPRQWAIYSLLFLVILAVFVSLLPAGDSLGFFSVIATVFGFLLQVFIFISQLILGILLLLFSLPFLLFGNAPPLLLDSTPPPLPTLPTQPVSPMANSALWELIKSIFLWGFLAVILVYSFLRFVRQHDGLLTALRKSSVGNWLLLAWQWLYKNVNKTRAGLAQAIAEGWNSIRAQRDGTRGLPRLRLINVRSLDARRRIYFFYLAMIRRGSEQGLTRQPSQTPSEYALELEKAVPAAREDIDSMTEAFIEARYSHHEVNVVKADLVKATWERIRRAFQVKSKNK